MYLFISEEGSLLQIESYDEADKQGVLDGFCDIVRFKDGNFEYLRREDGETWIPLKTFVPKTY